MSPLRLFLTRARLGVAAVLTTLTMVPVFVLQDIRMDEFRRHVFEGLDLGGYTVLAAVLGFAVWRIAALRRSAAPDVKTARHRLWAVLVAATLIASGPSLGLIARTLLLVTSEGPRVAVAETCLPQLAVQIDEGQLQGAFFERRLLLELSEEDCRSFEQHLGDQAVTDLFITPHYVVDFPTHRPTTWERVRYIPGIHDERTTNRIGWGARDAGSVDAYLRALYVQWTHDEVRSTNWPLRGTWMRDVVRAWATVLLAFSLPLVWRRPLRPERDLSRIAKLATCVAIPLLVFGLSDVDLFEDAETLAIVPPVVAGFLSVVVLGWGRYRKGMNLAWAGLHSLLLAAAVWPMWEDMSWGLYPAWTLWEPWVTAAVLAAMVVYVPLYTAINERIRVLPE